jgi:predicted dehydrogenase
LNHDAAATKNRGDSDSFLFLPLFCIISLRLDQSVRLIACRFAFRFTVLIHSCHCLLTIPFLFVYDCLSHPVLSCPTALSLCDDVKLQAIGSRQQASADAFAALFSIPHAHGSFEALVADPEVDVIYIATPDALHAPHALMALRAGKHVLVEKPFTDSPETAASIVSEATSRGLFVMEALWTRFVPSVRRALDLVAQGRIGAVKLVQSDFGCAFPIPAGALNALGVYSIALGQMVYEADARRAMKEAGSATADGAAGTPAAAATSGAASEASEPAASIVPIPNEVRASGCLRNDGQSDSQVGVVVRYGSEQLNVFSASLLVNGANGATIHGSQGRIKLHSPLWHSTDRLTVTAVDGSGLDCCLQAMREGS